MLKKSRREFSLVSDRVMCRHQFRPPEFVFAARSSSFLLPHEQTRINCFGIEDEEVDRLVKKCDSFCFQTRPELFFKKMVSSEVTGIWGTRKQTVRLKKL